MLKKPKKEEVNKQADEDNAFEIIELAIDDINVLTRAFQVINTICEELTAEPADQEEDDLHGIPDHFLH